MCLTGIIRAKRMRRSVDRVSRSQVHCVLFAIIDNLNNRMWTNQNIWFILYAQVFVEGCFCCSGLMMDDVDDVVMHIEINR